MYDCKFSKHSNERIDDVGVTDSAVRRWQEDERGKQHEYEAVSAARQPAAESETEDGLQESEEAAQESRYCSSTVIHPSFLLKFDLLESNR